jgi:hypothetical protein
MVLVTQAVEIESQFEASLCKKLARPHLNYKPGMVVCVCNPNYMEDYR